MRNSKTTVNAVICKKRLGPILRKHKVDIYACGHIHNFQLFVCRAVILITWWIPLLLWVGGEGCGRHTVPSRRQDSIFTVDKKRVGYAHGRQDRKSNLYGKTYEIDLAIWGKRVYLQHNVCCNNEFTIWFSQRTHELLVIMIIDSWRMLAGRSACEHPC